MHGSKLRSNDKDFCLDDSKALTLKLHGCESQAGVGLGGGSLLPDRVVLV